MNSNQHIACEQLWPGTVNVDPCWEDWRFICFNASENAFDEWNVFANESAHHLLDVVWFDHRQSALRWNDMLPRDRNNGWRLVGVYACHGFVSIHWSCKLAADWPACGLLLCVCTTAVTSIQLTDPINATTRRCSIMSCLTFVTLLSESEID